MAGKSTVRQTWHMCRYLAGESDIKRVRERSRKCRFSYLLLTQPTNQPSTILQEPPNGQKRCICLVRNRLCPDSRRCIHVHAGLTQPHTSYLPVAPNCPPLLQSSHTIPLLLTHTPIPTVPVWLASATPSARSALRRCSSAIPSSPCTMDHRLSRDTSFSACRKGETEGRVCMCVVCLHV